MPGIAKNSNFFNNLFSFAANTIIPALPTVNRSWPKFCRHVTCSRYSLAQIPMFKSMPYTRVLWTPTSSNTRPPHRCHFSRKCFSKPLKKARVQSFLPPSIPKLRVRVAFTIAIAAKVQCIRLPKILPNAKKCFSTLVIC